MALASCKKGPSASKERDARPRIRTSGYAELLQNIEDRKLRKEVEAFGEGGVERPLIVQEGSPEDLIKAASAFMGTPHRMGGLSRKGIDCSGLLVVAFGKLGVQVPHNSEQLARLGRIVPGRDELKRGDLVFFIRTYRTSNFITHAGIYLGQGDFIHTSSSRGVMVSSLDDPHYWQPKYIFGTRVFD